MLSAIRPPPLPAALRAARLSSAVTSEQSPLFLRPLSHSTSAADLKAFHSWASSLCLSSPDPPHLLRELRWLLHDASANALDTHLLFSPSSPLSFPLRVHLQELYQLWKQRVLERRPFQYIVGCEHWRDLVLVVREGVLIPRPETELVVDLVGKVMEEQRMGCWADLGTGSGALAVGIARLMGDGFEGKVYATDVSEDAVEVAKINVSRYGLEDKVEIRQGSWFEPLGDLMGKLAGVVSNPPYIPNRDLPGLQSEVSEHEPWLALDGGEDGLNHLLHLCKGSSLALRPGGFFVFETNGDNQCEFLADFMTSKFACSCYGINIVRDSFGVGRFISGFRK